MVLRGIDKSYGFSDSVDHSRFIDYIPRAKTASILFITDNYYICGSPSGETYPRAKGHFVITIGNYEIW